MAFGLIKKVTSLAAQSMAFERFVGLLEQAGMEKPGLLRVLTYHRVDEPDARPWLDPALISASPQAFARQMEYLAAHYRVISVTDILRAFEAGNLSLPSRAVLLTFDDAYCDFAEHAWPVLKRFGLPATLFVPTAYPDHPSRTFWWDDLYHAVLNTAKTSTLNTPVGPLTLSGSARLHTYKRLKTFLKTLNHSETLARVRQYCQELDVPPRTNNVLGWDALRLLAEEGVALGAHTRTHPLMDRIELQEAREEATGSLKDLEREIGSALPVFAYPGGGYNDQVVRMLKQEGFKVAFTTQRGINGLHNSDPLQIRRINVGGRTSLAILRAQLLPLTIHFNRLQPFMKLLSTINHRVTRRSPKTGVEFPSDARPSGFGDSSNLRDSETDG